MRSISVETMRNIISEADAFRKENGYHNYTNIAELYMKMIAKRFPDPSDTSQTK